MNKVSSAEALSAVEWLDWDRSVLVVRTAGVGIAPYRVLAEWCAQGLIDSKASMITIEGNMERDCELVPAIWKLGDPDPLDGSMRVAYEGSTASIVGPLFCKAQVLRMVAHVDQRKVVNALATDGCWLDFGRTHSESKPVAVAVAVAETPGAKRGRKTDKVRWTAFWFAAVELAREGRLKRGCFQSAQELGEELLSMMGDDAFSADYVKAEVGQLYKRFVGD